MEASEFFRLAGVVSTSVISLIIIALWAYKYGPWTVYKLRYGKYLTETYKDVIVVDVRIYGKDGAFLVVETDDYARFLLADYKLPGYVHVAGDVFPLRVVSNSKTGRIDYYNDTSLEFTYYPE